jgi:histidinol-phosphate aminotransferase
VTTDRYVWQPTSDEIARRFDLSPDRIVRFDQNTSPYPTDWASAVAGTALNGLNEYPAASYRPLREAAAEYTGVNATQVVPGAGVDELILLAARALLSPGDRAAGLTPTYPLYRIATEQQGAAFVESPSAAPGPDEGTALTWLCVPNNPTGDRLSDAEIARVLDRSAGIVVIDAAYAEFTGDRWGPWIDRYERLLVLHTLSKGFGLAGVRVGYAIGNPSLIDAIDRVRPPGSISTVSATLAVAALSEPDRMQRAVDSVIAERARLFGMLRALGLDVRPSKANFLLTRIGPDAAALAARLMREGLVVREFPHIPELQDHLRFTVRSAADNDRLIETIERIRP